MATGVLNSTATLYYGPSTTLYPSDTTFPAGTKFNVLWKEGTWYYVSLLGGARRNYVQSNLITVTGTAPIYNATFAARSIITTASTRFGPTNNYPTNGTLGQGQVVLYVVGKKEGDFALVQTRDTATGKLKRVWFEHMKVAIYSGPANHQYISGTYKNIPLQIIKTYANHITLRTLNRTSSLTSSNYYGINGGWFDINYPNGKPAPVNTLNISMQNGSIVPGDTANPSNSGGSINNIGMGAIYWTGSALRFVRTSWASNISNTSSTGTWAQGGVYLYLGNSSWYDKVSTNEQCPYAYYTSPSEGRTAIVANTNNNQVYLIITTGSQNLTAFRAAIQSYLGITDGSSDNSIYKGLLLDGGGSSQLKCKNSSGTEISQPNRTRNLTQIITLSDKL